MKEAQDSKHDILEKPSKKQIVAFVKRLVERLNNSAIHRRIRQENRISFEKLHQRIGV